MDQRIFDQLDRLERGARETAPRRDAYNNSSAEYSAYDGYDGYDGGYGQQELYHDAYQQPVDGFADQPLTLDSFGICSDDGDVGADRY